MERPLATNDDAATSKSWRDVLPVHPAADLFPLMSETELKELAEDIRKNGMQVPVVMWMDPLSGEQYLLDGRNRLDAAEMLGTQFVTADGRLDRNARASKGVLVEWRTLSGYTDPCAFVISANIKRRHLTAEQRQELLIRLISLAPEKSDRAIAAKAGVSHKAVGRARKKGERLGRVSHLTKTVGKDGRARTRKAKGKSAPKDKPPAKTEAPAKTDEPTPSPEQHGRNMFVTAFAEGGGYERFRDFFDEAEKLTLAGEIDDEDKDVLAEALDFIASEAARIAALVRAKPLADAA
jgi:hypothetical protein